MAKKYKLKPGISKFLKVCGVILIIFIIGIIYYSSNVRDLTDLGYSKKAAKKIILEFKKKEIVQYGKSKTLNAAFESNDYDENNINKYYNITYQDHKHLIRNINSLLKLGYSEEEISLILSHGTDDDATAFIKKGKVKYVDEFFSLDYAKLRNYDRYLAYKKDTGDNFEVSVMMINLDMDKEGYTDPTIVNTFSYTMLINKRRTTTDEYVPDDLVKISKDYTSDTSLKANKIALEAMESMIDDAKKEGFNITINSAYRSYQDQEEIESTYKELYGEAYVTKYVSKPGFSEHQTGLAFDIGSTDTNIFINSDEYSWVVDNCYKYGFIYRFKTKYEDLTEIRSEAWHYRYVGKKAAKYIYENDISLEEYYAKFLYE